MGHPTAPEFVWCAKKDCPNKIKNHAWGFIKADGWFKQKDGTIWCPEHIPEWVNEWRKKRAKKEST